MADSQNMTKAIYTDVQIELHDIVELFRLQLQDIRRESNGMFEDLLERFHDHHINIVESKFESSKEDVLKTGCFYFIQKLQYADTLDQRLLHIENGLENLQTALCSIENEPDSACDNQNAVDILNRIEHACRMETEKTVITKFLRQLDTMHVNLR
jgi:hypothetical protein